MWLIAMQRRWPATNCRSFRPVELSNNHITQRHRIWVQVSLIQKPEKYSHQIIWISIKNDLSCVCVCVRRTTSGSTSTQDFPADGLTRDGTPCGANLVCVNQTCVSLFPYIDQTRCPTNNNNIECNGKGVSAQNCFNFRSFGEKKVKNIQHSM